MSKICHSKLTQLLCIVTNVTNFRVVVDIGIKHDGLVHVSQFDSSQAHSIAWHVL